MTTINNMKNKRKETTIRRSNTKAVTKKVKREHKPMTLKLATEITNKTVTYNEFIEDFFGNEGELEDRIFPAFKFYFANNCDFEKCKKEYVTYQKKLPNECQSKIVKLKTKNVGEIKGLLDKYGVAVLIDVITPFECDIHFEKTLLEFTKLYPVLNDINKWDSFNTPSRHRLGMYQSIFSQISVAWSLRLISSKIFKEIWGVDEIGSSQDGCFVSPPGRGKEGDNWLHIDCVDNDSELFNENHLPIQSQFVLTNTSASFVACLGDQKAHQKVIEEIGLISINTKKYVEKHNAIVKKSGKGKLWKLEEVSPKVPEYWHFLETELGIVRDVYGAENYKVPIYSNAGSMIFWYSTTPHQAQRQFDSDFWCIERITQSSKLFTRLQDMHNWRCVYYICQLPITFYSENRKKQISNAYIEGTSTNHLGKPFPRFGKYDKVKNDRNIQVYHNPSMYQVSLTKEMRKLAFIEKNN